MPDIHDQDITERVFRHLELDTVRVYRHLELDAVLAARFPDIDDIANLFPRTANSSVASNMLVYCSDRPLVQAALAVDRLHHMTGLDIPTILTTLTSPAHVIDLAFQLWHAEIQFEYDAGLQLGRGTGPHFDAVLTHHNVITDRFRRARTELTDHPLVQELLFRAVASIGAEHDTTPVQVAIGPIGDTPLASDARTGNRRIWSAALLFHVPAATRTRQIVTIPRWLYDGVHGEYPGLFLSSPLVDVDDDLLQAALTLWSHDRTETYADFDTCIAAARALRA